MSRCRRGAHAGRRAVGRHRTFVEFLEDRRLLTEVSMSHDAEWVLAARSAAESESSVAGADLTVSMSDGVAIATVGEPLTYDLVVHNAGSVDVQGAELAAPVPPGRSARETIFRR